MANTKLPLNDFELAAVGALGVLGFIARATKKRPTFMEILAFPAELAPFTTVNWQNIGGQVMDIDAEESKALLEKATEKLEGIEQPQLKAVAKATVEAIEPTVKAITQLKAIYDAFKGPKPAEVANV